MTTSGDTIARTYRDALLISQTPSADSHDQRASLTPHQRDNQCHERTGHGAHSGIPLRGNEVDGYGLPAAMYQWYAPENILEVLQYLDTSTLIEKKLVCHQWQQLCTTAIDCKRRTQMKSFETNKELRTAVQTYVRYERNDAEELAQTYGWPIGKWDTSRLEDFSCIFDGQGYEDKFDEDGNYIEETEEEESLREEDSIHLANFNEDISSWDVSNAKRMDKMFMRAKSFNSDLSSWDTSKVTKMDYLFCRAEAFNQNISSWDTSKVKHMQFMFRSARSFNQDIGQWDTSSVTGTSYMFAGAESFNADISLWDMSKVRKMKYMFYDAISFNQNIGRWNTSNAIAMREMFSGAEAFNQDLSAWNTANVRSMQFMFARTKKFNQDIGAWNTSNVRAMNFMFAQAQKFNQDLSKWDIRNVQNMKGMFDEASAFARHNVHFWKREDIFLSWDHDYDTDNSSIYSDGD